MEVASVGVRHQGGVFPRVLTGDERLRAHEAIRVLTNVGTGRKATPEQDAELAQWVSKDVSLFVERIPQQNPLAACAEEWESHATWWGTWAYRVANHGMLGTAKALFEAGVRPDDGDVFQRHPLWLESWSTNPQRVAMLLSHGANPDAAEAVDRPGGVRGNPNSSPLLRCIAIARSNASSLGLSAYLKAKGSYFPSEDKSEGRRESVVKALECALLLLRAGARRLDPSAEDFVFDDGVVRDKASTRSAPVGSLISAVCDLATFPEERKLAVDVLRAALTAGADVDRRSGESQEPPLIHAIRAKDIEAFELLLELGADSRDSVLVTKSSMYSGGVVKPLLEEAEEAGGIEFRCRVTESMMRATVSRTVPTADAARAVAPRRRSKVV